MIVSFWLFILGSLACVFAPTIELLLAARMLQAFSAGGIVVSRAVVRDTVGAAEAASRMGYITMAMSVAPMIGPVIGGALDEVYGWQSTFMLTGAFGIIALAAVYLDLGETNLNPSKSLTEQFGAYPMLLKSKRFWGYTFTAAFISGGFYAFVGGGPYVASEMLHLSPSEYGFYFGIVSVGYLIGNFGSGRYSVRVGINRMMMTGNVVSLLGMLLSIGLFASGYEQPLALFGPMLFMGMGNGITLPNAAAGMVSVRPDLAGSASGLGGALQIGGGAAFSVLAAALLGPDTGPYPLIYVMILSALLAVLATFFVIYANRPGWPA